MMALKKGIIFSLLISYAVHAEFIFLTKSTSSNQDSHKALNYETLSQQEKEFFEDLYEKTIYRYSWPTVLIYYKYFSAAEKQVYHAALQKPQGLEQFIKNQVETLSQGKYTITFIPTPIFEMCALYLYLSARLKIDSYFLQKFNRLPWKLQDYIHYISDQRKDFIAQLSDLEKNELNNFSKGATCDLRKEQLNLLYWSLGQDVCGMPLRDYEYMCNEQACNFFEINEKKIFLNLYFYTNDFCLHELEINQLNDMDYISRVVQDLGRYLHDAEKELIIQSLVKSAIYALYQKEMLPIILNYIEIEKIAVRENKFLLVRGTSGYIQDFVNKKGAIDIDKFFGVDYPIEELKPQKAKAKDLSYASSLFTGSIFERSQPIGARPLDFMLTGLVGYVVPIKIADSLNSKSIVSQLFYIPHLTSISNLFGQGEYFHPRIRYALSEEQDIARSISKRSPRYSNLTLSQFKTWLHFYLKDVVIIFRNEAKIQQLFPKNKTNIVDFLNSFHQTRSFIQEQYLFELKELEKQHKAEILALKVKEQPKTR